eukprot:2179090-Amphidinium_carterae.1
MIGIWTSQDKKKTKALDPKDSIGRFLTCDTWWTGITEILTTDEEGDSVIAKGLKPLRAEPDMVKLELDCPTVILVLDDLIYYTARLHQDVLNLRDLQ